MTNPQKLEKVGLSLSSGVTLFMSILGISFGIWIDSNAILLDGFFNVVSFLMSIVTLWVAWLQTQPENPRFQFGYISFIPLVNLSKGLLIFTLSLFALVSAISTILHGGRSLNANVAVIYALIAGVGCIVTAFIQRKMATQTRSIMLTIDAKNWIINGLISLSVGIAFGLVSLIKNTGLSWFIPYADSTIVTVLVLVTLPIPIQIILQNLKQLLLGAPNSELQQQIKQIFESASQEFAREKYWLRTTQIGNYIFVSIYWLLPSNCEHYTVREFDQIRETVVTAFQETFSELIVDIIFTQQSKWADDVEITDD
ncbi:MAG: cation diffusion facilitator family transporter [Microcystaceae cyanobacterium]